MVTINEGVRALGLVLEGYFNKVVERHRKSIMRTQFQMF